MPIGGIEPRKTKRLNFDLGPAPSTKKPGKTADGSAKSSDPTPATVANGILNRARGRYGAIEGEGKITVTVSKGSDGKPRVKVDCAGGVRISMGTEKQLRDGILGLPKLSAQLEAAKGPITYTQVITKG